MIIAGCGKPKSEPDGFDPSISSDDPNAHTPASSDGAKSTPQPNSSTSSSSTGGEPDTVWGVWTGGGGGEVISDALNPWFVQNTKEVVICPVVDTDHFHVDGSRYEVLSESINEALKFWKAEFAKSYVVANAVRVATQDFRVTPLVKVSQGNRDSACPSDTMLKVQFGFADEAQLQWMARHGYQTGRVIGLAVRTDYDRVNLRGKGFVLLAGDSGPTAIKHPDLMNHPWEKGSTRIIEVLKHELGHVFGVPHRGLGVVSVMAPDYGEALLAKSSEGESANGMLDTPFFAIDAPWTIRDYCSGVRYGWKKFLGAKDHDQCTSFKYIRELPGPDRIDFATGPSMEHLTLRGRLEFDANVTFQWEDMVRLFVTEEQKAIRLPDPSAGAGSPPLLTGPLVRIVERQGVFKSIDGKLERKVEVTFNPRGLGYSQAVFRVEMDGKVYRNLDFVYQP